MADVLKVLGQVALAATTLTDVYTVPDDRKATVSSVVICNRGAAAAAFRIAVAVAGAADATKQYLYYDLAIPAKDTFIATIGATLGASDVLRAYSDLATVSVNVFGVEVV